MNTLFTGLVAAAALSLAALASAAERHVPAQYPTIQAAIDASHPGDTVVVADGEYVGAGNRDISFGGKAITVRSANGAAACVINCEGTPEVPHRGIQFTSGEGPGSVLEGFTITGGSTLPGAIADQFNGGGILCNGSSPTIRGCVIRDNACGCWGGAICATNASPTIIDCRIIDNHADDDGGAIFAWNNSHPKVINTLVAGNDATVFGGGIVQFDGTLEVTNCTVVGNVAGGTGGVYGFGATIRNSIVWGNTGMQVNGALTVTHSNVEGGADGLGNLDTNPRFVDPANGDFHLRPDSPLVDAGDPAFTPDPGAVDFDGQPRLIGLAVDIGADEHLRPGDVDFDGAVTIDDVVRIVVAWGACNGCPEDVNGDGDVNIDDMVIAILNWGG